MKGPKEPDSTSTSTLETELPFHLQKTWRSSFYQALQLVRSLDFTPSNSTTAAIFSLLFQQLDIKPSLKSLHTWLDSYIFPFATDNLRNQADQSEKSLAVATYLYISEQNNFDICFPSGDLIDHIEYASNQAWFGDSFLAFYCHNLRNNVVACENVGEYFRDNFERFLIKRHVPSICQTLLVLGSQLPDKDREKASGVICSALSERPLSLNHAAWGLLALSSNSNHEYQSEVTRLISQIDSELTDFTAGLLRESQLSGLLFLMRSGSDREDLRRFVDRLPTVSPNSFVDVNLSNPESVSITFNCAREDLETVNNQFNHPLLADTALALLAMHSAQAHNVLGVVEADETRLISCLQTVKYLEREGSVVLYRQENILSNLLAIVATFLVGLTGGLFFLGVKLDYVFDFSKVSYRDFDIALFALVWADFLWSQVQALRSGQSALHGMLQLPLIRHLPAIRQLSSKLTSISHKEE